MIQHKILVVFMFLLRLYELADEDQNFVRDITYATNSQNPVDLRDLHSNDEIQKQLEIGIGELKYNYKSKREEGGGGTTAIASTIVAEAVLAIWRNKPHQAKFLRREHFGKLYQEIFKNLNAAQAVLAVFIFRIVENERKKAYTTHSPRLLTLRSTLFSNVSRTAIATNAKLENGTSRS